MHWCPRKSTFFPSPTLSRPQRHRRKGGELHRRGGRAAVEQVGRDGPADRPAQAVMDLEEHADEARGALRDRKSTRLNSSHANISYAVFCLKKKQTSLPTFPR